MDVQTDANLVQDGEVTAKRRKLMLNRQLHIAAAQGNVNLECGNL